MGKSIEDIITDLLSREKLTAEEQAFFEEWIQNESNRKIFCELQKIQAAVNASKTGNQIDVERSWKQFNQKIIPQKRLIRFLPYAAAIAIVGFGLAMLTLKNKTAVPDQVCVITTPITTGQKQTVLTLSTGQQIVLSDTLSPLKEQNGAILQNAGNQLTYTPSNSSNLLVYNTVSVPRGGEYKLALSDGSAVWVNSESEITYPVAFGSQKREVRLKGEAFFEIQKDSLRPFIVHTEQFDIRVTGTQFNVRTYPNDVPSATLAKGGIQLEKDRHITHLVPGQQASLVNGQVEIKMVNLEEAIAWRYEVFCFKQRSLESLLNEIARWYDIEILYLNNDVRNYHFTAWFRRSAPLHEIIQILEKTQEIKLELKGKTLIVKAN